MAPYLDTIWNLKKHTKLLDRQMLAHLIYLVPDLWSFDLCYCGLRESIIKYSYLLSKGINLLLYLIRACDTILGLPLKTFDMLLKFVTVFMTLGILLLVTYYSMTNFQLNHRVCKVLLSQVNWVFPSLERHPVLP